MLTHRAFVCTRPPILFAMRTVVNLSLAGQVAVVTGGAKGIGAATAAMFAGAGAQVAIFDVAPGDGAPVDVTSESAVEKALTVVAAEYGGIDILVNNAGSGARKPTVDLKLAEWQAVV